MHGTCGLRVTKIGEVLGKGEQGVIKDIPSLAAGLCQHMHGGLGIALGFIMEALSQGIDLHRALHHQGPRNQRALRHRPGAVALVAAQVGELGPELLAPLDGAAVVALVARIQRVFHLWQQGLDQGGVATKAIASQQHAVATELLQLAIGSHKADA